MADGCVGKESHSGQGEGRPVPTGASLKKTGTQQSGRSHWMMSWTGEAGVGA